MQQQLQDLVSLHLGDFCTNVYNIIIQCLGNFYGVFFFPKVINPIERNISSRFSSNSEALT